jgi:hypothetical protein
MDFFVELYDNDELVSAERLAEFGILNINPGRESLKGTDIRRYFDRIGLTKDIDYDWRRQLAPPKTGKRGGARSKDVYMLTYDGFKKCLSIRQK